jgi:hypothetical protein
MVSPPNGDEGMLVLEKRGSQRTSPELLDFTSSVLAQSINPQAFRTRRERMPSSFSIAAGSRLIPSRMCLSENSRA